MSVTVILHIFSGQPDPAWELSNDQVQELSARLRQIQNTTLLKPAGLAGPLGYRGFSVHSVGAGLLEPHIYIHGGVVDIDRFDLNRITDTPDLEKWLLSTAGTAITEGVRQTVDLELSTGMIRPLDTTVQRRFVPPYEPGKWNNNPNIRTQNNCYNYANDKITYTRAQPGRGSGQIYSVNDCGDVGAASQRDGQISVGPPATTPEQGHFIALFIWPNEDFHWYRLDSSGMWSHKPGQNTARDTDNSMNTIHDPRSCNRGPYTIFCGFYHCIPNNTRIR